MTTPVSIRHLTIRTDPAGTAVDISDHIQALTLNETQTSRTYWHAGSLRRKKTGVITHVLQGRLSQQRGAGQIDAILAAAMDSEDSVDVVVRPSSAAVSEANPQWAGKVVVTAYTPMSGQYGDIETFAVNWASDGPLVRTTS